MLYILIGLCAVFVGVFLYSEIKEDYIYSVVFKGMASVCFVLIGALHNFGAPFSKMIVIGLFLGCVADVILNLRFLLKKYNQLAFAVGTVVFLAGHVLYLAAIIPFSRNPLLSVAVGVVLTAILSLWIFRRIKVKPALLALGIVYLGVITILNAVAFGNLLIPRSLFDVIFAMGTLLFLISDIVLIINTFGGKFRNSFRVVNILLYYTGQILIAVSLSYFMQ